ncbi:hypothetical protein EOM39_00100 [Candidatus Gracilibacteria bacterium]|nr:hypothetical protein [Candidatus Gracilibacteria bacterium]
MKNVINKHLKKVFLGTSIFIISLIILDIILSIFFDKDVNRLIENKIEIVAKEKSRKSVDMEKVSFINDIPYWDSEYRGPFLNYKYDKQLKCRILGIGDSIMQGSGVGGNSTYLYNLSKKLDNTEIINMAIPGFDLLQEIIKYNEEKLGDNTDLLIWHIWSDDDNIYKYINGVLYDSEVVINDYGEPILFSYIPRNINLYLIKNSYIYNKLLKIKIKNDVKKTSISNINYVINKLDIILKDYLSKGNNKKVLLIFSPSLDNNSYSEEFSTGIKGVNPLYTKIENKLSQYNNIKMLYLDKFFKGIEVKEIRHDPVCHFNEKGHKIISEKLYEYIKTNKLLDDKCY